MLQPRPQTLRYTFLVLHISLFGLIYALNTADELLLIHSFYTSAPTLLVDQRTEIWLCSLAIVVCIACLSMDRAKTDGQQLLLRKDELFDVAFHIAWLASEAVVVLLCHVFIRNFENNESNPATMLSESRWCMGIVALVSGAALLLPIGAILLRTDFRAAAGGVGLEFWLNGALLVGRQLSRAAGVLLALVHLGMASLQEDCTRRDRHTTCVIQAAHTEVLVTSVCEHCMAGTLSFVVLLGVGFGVLVPFVVESTAVETNVATTRQYSSVVHQMAIIHASVALFGIDSYKRHQATEDVSVCALFTAAVLLASTVGRAVPPPRTTAARGPQRKSVVAARAAAPLRAEAKGREHPVAIVASRPILVTGRPTSATGSLLRLRADMGTRNKNHV